MLASGMLPPAAMVSIDNVIPIPAQLFAVVGANYTLKCRVDLDVQPPCDILTEPTIVWRKGGELVENNNKTRVLSTGILEIYNFDRSLNGDYRCSVTVKFMNQMPMEDHAVVKVELASE